jgi:hypothetical protein
VHNPITVRLDGGATTLYLLEAGTAAGQFRDGTLDAITGLR